MRTWGPVTNPTARTLASWLCALWGWHEGPWGGRLGPGCQASRVGRSPCPSHPSFGACGRGPQPTGCGCGGCGHGDLSPSPQRALLRAGFVRCRGGMRAPGGGAWCLAVGRPGSGALQPPTARPVGRAAGALYPLAVGAGGAGVGTRHHPHSARSCELALRTVGAARGRPGGGASCLGVGRPGSGALPPPTASPLGGAAGALYPQAVGAGDAGMGTRHQPDSAPSCELALQAVGAARGRPGGGASCLGVGRPGSGALPPPTVRPLGRAAGAHYPLAVVAGGVGVGIRPEPYSARSCELALRAVEVARGRPGGAPRAWTSGVQGRALSLPRPSVLWGVRQGPICTGCGCGGRGTWDTSQAPQRALLCACFARCGGGKRAPRGGASCLRAGRPGSGALPTPTARPLGHAARARYQRAVGAVCGPGGPGVLGTFFRAAVRRVLCALPGFAAPCGRCCLAPVLAPWLWPAACLCGVPHGPASVSRALSGPVALGAPVGFPVAVVPTPTLGAVAPGFSGWLCRARGGRPRTGFIVPAAHPGRG